MRFNCVDRFNSQGGHEGNLLIILILNPFDLSF